MVDKAVVLLTFRVWECSGRHFTVLISECINQAVFYNGLNVCVVDEDVLLTAERVNGEFRNILVF